MAGRQDDAKPRQPIDHALISFGGAFEREYLVD
jgi:hypothetical protein